MPEKTQQAELDAIGTKGQRGLVDAFMRAWERADVAALVELLAEDARFTMPPLPAWFHGQEDIGRFFADRMFRTPWRLVPLGANGQPAFAGYQGGGGSRPLPARRDQRAGHSHRSDRLDRQLPRP